MMSRTDMDVDFPSTGTGHNSGSSLKRSNSAPMINEIGQNQPTIQPNVLFPPKFTNVPISWRSRRLSMNFPPSPTNVGGPRLTPRVNQLRQEEYVDTSNQREMAHERELHSSMQISQSWEDLSLVSSDNDSCSSHSIKSAPCSNYTDGRMNRLFINTTGGISTTSGTSHSACSSPSPTRIGTGFGRPYNYSPCSLSLKSSPSPKAKLFTTRRSLSPTIAIRPSNFIPSTKRKFELDDDYQLRSHFGPPKKKIYTTEQRNLWAFANNNTAVAQPNGVGGRNNSAGTPDSFSGSESPVNNTNSQYMFQPLEIHKKSTIASNHHHIVTGNKSEISANNQDEPMDIKKF